MIVTDGERESGKPLLAARLDKIYIFIYIYIYIYISTKMSQSSTLPLISIVPLLFSTKMALALNNP